MNAPLKIVGVGNPAGVVLPKQLLARLGIGIGDSLSVEDVKGGIALARMQRTWRPKWRSRARSWAVPGRALRKLAE